MEEKTVDESGGQSSQEETKTIGVSSPPSSVNSVGDSSGNAPIRERNERRRKIPESQAKRRMEAMASGVDSKLAGMFFFVFTLYAMITIAMWFSLESQEYRHEIFEQFRHSSVKRHKRLRENILKAVKTNDYSKPRELDAAPARAGKISAEDIGDIETVQHTFPLHAHDTEIIDHPGIFLSDPKKIKRVLEKHAGLLPADGKMKVPKFWRPTAYGPGGVREFLGNYGETLITPEKASQIGNFHPETGMKTVYVSVASYRDPECRPTVEDIFLRAEYPERLRVAVVEQRVAGEDEGIVPHCVQPQRPCQEDPEQVLCKYENLIDLFVVPAVLSIGPVFARHIANRMYRGEYFAMQVDSHVRFIRNWDSDLIAQWESAQNEMGIITTYLSDITDSIDPVTFENRHPNRPIMCATGYEGRGKMKHLRHGQQPEGIPHIHGEPTLHPFWAAGFSFARGHFVVQVPYDQYEPMVFQGEEIFMGLRAWSYGYDFYTAEKSVAFHMYAIKKNKDKRSKIKLFWENSNLYPGAAIQGMKRLNGIIGTGDPGDVYYDAEEKEYGLGKVRPKEQFYKLYGIHTDTQTVEDNLCRFVGKPMQSMFKPFLRKNRMGIDFSNVGFEYKNEKE